MKYQVLRQVFGYASFREGQAEIIDALLAGRDALGVMPTGAGKSLCFQVPALMLPGVTLVISPLISLMKDQVAALKQAGVAAAYINSSLTPGQSAEALRRAAAGWYRIIYVAPERLDSPDFLQFALSTQISMVTIDEAHCVSQWGQDFRPSYLRIPDFIARLPERPRASAFTATATPRVRQDIMRLLGLRDPLCITTGFDRPNLYFEVMQPADKYQALRGILRGKEERCGVIYCATRKAVEEVCTQLCADGFSATRYHAGLSDEERRTNQDDFQYDRRLIMVATNAFGMGIDKSNVSFVIHYNMPKNLESYYQEAGRAGRDGSPADCVLLYAKRDVVTAKWLIEHAEENPDLSDRERGEVRERDMERLRQMTFYSTTKDCLRRFILRYFGEQGNEKCGHCSSCLAPVLEALKAIATESADTRRPAEDALLPRLKALRKRLAAEKGVPAYTVFSDYTLQEMDRLRPQTKEELLAVGGVGEVKLRQYGEVFLREIAGEEKPRRTPKPTKSKKKLKKEMTYIERQSAKGLTNASQPWDKEEDDRLCDEHRHGLTVTEMSKSHLRTRGAIQARLKKLELEE